MVDYLNLRGYPQLSFELLVEISEKSEDIKGVSYNLQHIGMIYQDKGDYDQALNNYEKAMKMREKIGDFSGTASSLGQMGKLYFETKDYRNAMKKNFLFGFVMLFITSPRSPARRTK